MNRKKVIDKQKMQRKLMRSPAYRIAYKDREFLASPLARPARLELELLKTEIGMIKNNVKSTIVTFGGTRIEERSGAERKVKVLQNRLKKNPKDKTLKRKLRIARSVLEKSSYYQEAREFARLVSSECQIRDHHEYVIVTGGGPGIMEAANRGAYDVGAKSVGLNITLPLEQHPNAYITPQLCFQFHYFAIRKMHFMLRAKALVAFPGGFGTMDELFEALTLVQTEKIKPLPIVLFGEKYWKELIDFDFMVDQGTIDEKDVDLFTYADSAADAWNYIKNFYQNSDG
jgi:uncharacterized protein (TIGR00730 family)